MYNIFEIHKLLKSNESKQIYKYLKLYLYNKILDNESIINIYNNTYNIILLYKYLTNIEYLIFANIKDINGGIIIDDINKLKNNLLTNIEKENIFNKLFNTIITKENIKYPLCNCCLKKFISVDEDWKTSKNQCKEFYYNNKKYTSFNYIHICGECDILLNDKLTEYYNKIDMIIFNKQVFHKQSLDYIKYEPICFDLLLNYNLKKIIKLFRTK